LNCFPKAHFIGQDPVELLVIHRHHPIEPNVLVFTECVFQ
jgi:hypothetical protein